MKPISYSTLALACLVQMSIAHGADSDLIGLITETRQASAIANPLKPSPVAPGIKDAQRRTLKPISAFGGIFEGEVAFTDGAQIELLLWPQEPSLSPQTALDQFNKLASSLKSEIGQGKTISNIPNYGDASDVKSTAVLWYIGTDIIILQLNRYPSRGGVEVVRRNKEAWRNSMGADESDFWAQNLDSETSDEERAKMKVQKDPIKTHSEDSNASDTKSTSKPSEAPALITPWSVIVVLSVGAMCLLWFLKKKRN